MRSARALAAACGLALLATALSVSPASAAPQWTQLEVLGAHAHHVEMGVNSLGDAVAVWASGQQVEAS